MPNAYYRTSLVGGSVQALDYINGALLSDGDIAQVTVGSAGNNLIYFYQLQASSGATESSPNVIAPDTNPGTKRWILQKASTLPPGHIDGLECSHAADADHDITVAAGSCRDNSDTYDCVLASALTKQIDVAWAAGTNAGGMIGTLAINTLYLLGLIRNNTTGAIDAGWNTTATAPSGWSWMRTLDFVRTSSSSDITYSRNRYFGRVCHKNFNAPIEFATVSLQPTTWTAQSVSSVVHSALQEVQCLFGGRMSNNNEGNVNVYLSYDGTHTHSNFQVSDSGTYYGVGTLNQRANMYYNKEWLVLSTTSMYYKTQGTHSYLLVLNLCAIRFKR